MNTPTSAAVAPARSGALALLAAALLAAGLSACGGGSRPSAAALLRATFSAHAPIAGGSLELALAVDRGGASRGAGSPSAASRAAQSGFSFHLKGPFRGAGAGRFPSFALALELASGPQSVSAGALASSGHLYLEIGRSWFAAPASATLALERGYAQTGGLLAPAQGPGTPGIEPAAWLTRPTVAATASVDGVPSTRIVAGLNAARFLEDLARLSGPAALLGPAGAPLARGPLAALTGAVRSGRVELYSGVADHRLRRIAAIARLAPIPAAGSAAAASPPGLLTFDLRFTELNRPPSIAVPAHARPAAELARALERLASARPAPGA